MMVTRTEVVRRYDLTRYGQAAAIKQKNRRFSGNRRVANGGRGWISVLMNFRENTVCQSPSDLDELVSVR